MANEMMRAGVAIFIAAGNSAFSAQIGPQEVKMRLQLAPWIKIQRSQYTRQGPTEEGRIKPNIAFVGSSVNAPMQIQAMVTLRYLAPVWQHQVLPVSLF